MPKTEIPQTRSHQNASPHKDPATAGSTSAFANVLCAVDGTLTSAAAVEMAASLAGPTGHVTLLAVTAVSGSGAYTSAAISPGRVDLVLKNAKRIADDASVPSTTVVDPDGPPAETILARASDYDLLAIGAPANSWFADVLLGGVATTALSQCTTPILFARRSSELLRDSRILIASDGEAGSDHIVELAGGLGQSQGARVTLVNALGAESKMNPRAIQAQADALRRMLPNAGEPCIEPGKPWDVILEVAKHTKAALVVMGSRGLSGPRALGSVSRRVVHDALCSVLVVPPGQ